MIINNYKKDLFKGFIISNALSLTVIGIHKYINFRSGLLIYSEFIILPMLMGLVSSWCWRDLNLKGKLLTGYSILNGFLAILFSYIFLREGSLCLLIVSPLIFTFIIAGAFIGRGTFRKSNHKLNVSILSLLLFAFINDSLSDHQYTNMVADEIVINAPVKSVWQNVVAFEEIKSKNSFWLFRIGMPSPLKTTVDGYYTGAGRKCIFNNGYIFDEIITTYKVNQNLTFDIIAQPKDPEIMGHIDITRGQFLLKDNGDGTTTLTGNSWYKLNVFPIWYYDIWAESITRNVHLRVMEHIKIISEKG